MAPQFAAAGTLIREPATPLHATYVTARPFPLGPLLATLEERTLKAAAKRLHVDRAQLYRWRRLGLTVDQADELAVRAGFHPLEVWPQWLTAQEAC